MLYNAPVTWRFLSRIAVILLFLFWSGAFFHAAGKTRLSYKLVSIQVKGADRLRPEQIIAASGLSVGQVADDNVFKESVQKLGDTGLFKELTYSYRYSPEGCSLEFQVSENDKLVPIVFENFVWFTDDELVKLLHSRLPLFDGNLPLAGDLPDQVADALNAVLAERRIAGKAEYLRAGKEDGPIDSYAYKVNFRSIVVRNLDFPGASPAELAALQAAARKLQGQDYLLTRMRYAEKIDLAPVYLASGHLKVSFADPQPKATDEGNQTFVDVSFPVTPGAKYKLKQVQWSGNQALPAEQLQPLLKLKTGEPADAVELSKDLEQVEKLYGTKGYLFAHVTPAPELDEAESAVTYRLEVSEGDLFRMGELVIDGLDPDATSKMAAQWQMKAGDPFDNSYLTRFFKVMYRDIGLRGSWNVVPRQSVSQQDKTVSVTLHFMPKA